MSKPVTKAILNVVLAGLFVAYPIFVYLGLERFSPRVIGIGILIVLGIRVFVLALGQFKKLIQFIPLAVAVGVASGSSAVFDSQRMLLLTPVLISIGLLFSFGFTLVKKPSMIERFARLSAETLDASAIAYCKTVTIVWCIFFMANGTLAYISAVFLPREYWVLYNGLISYLLMGLLFIVEYMVRRIKIKQSH